MSAGTQECLDPSILEEQTHRVCEHGTNHTAGIFPRDSKEEEVKDGIPIKSSRLIDPDDTNMNMGTHLQPRP